MLQPKCGLKFLINEQQEQQEQQASQNAQQFLQFRAKQQSQQKQPTIVNILTNEAFSPTISLSLPLNESEDEIVSHTRATGASLEQMGFNPVNNNGWAVEAQASKDDIYKILREMINSFYKPSVRIQFGDKYFNCHLMVLQAYSEFFKKCGNEAHIQLPKKKEVTPRAFAMAYNWMIIDVPVIKREGIVELFKADTFLCIKQLMPQCWVCLKDPNLFREDTAFFLFLEAAKCGGLENIENLMIPRINKFFLTVVASDEFLCLKASHVIKLLESNYIGVNTEFETFMSAVRWLNYDWDNRKEHALDVMKTVRYALIPAFYLCDLKKETNCGEVDRIVANPDIVKLAQDEITCSTIYFCY